MEGLMVALLAFAVIWVVAVAIELHAQRSYR